MESSGPDCIPSLVAAFRSLSAVTSRLIGAGTWTDVVPDVLASLAATVGADRVSLFENYRAADGQLLAKLVSEWCSPGTAPAFAGGPGQEVAYCSSALPFGEELASRDAICGEVSDFDATSRLALERLSVRFVAAVAVGSAGRWWGSLQSALLRVRPRVVGCRPRGVGRGRLRPRIGHRPSAT